MFSLIRTFLRFGVIGLVGAGVLAGGALLIAGPKRSKVVFHKVQDQVLASIDECIDDPTALRAQLQDLEQEYPERIGQVRGDLAEIQAQIRQLEREQAIAERVVSMAEEDLAELEPLVAQAGNHVRDGNARAAVVSFKSKVFSVERASAHLNQIRHTRLAYASRAGDATHDLAYLRQQAGRLEELLAQLEQERAQFQSQIMQLARQVDAIERNERLIELLDKRNRTIEECTRYDLSSLDQLTSRLTEVRTRQEAELDHLASLSFDVSYEEMARMQVQTGMDAESESSSSSSFATAQIER